MIQFINKKGEKLQIVKPYRKRLYNKKVYTLKANIYAGTIQENIKAINGYIAIIKFCLKHPIILFKLN